MPVQRKRYSRGCCWAQVCNLRAGCRDGVGRSFPKPAALQVHCLFGSVLTNPLLMQQLGSHWLCTSFSKPPAHPIPTAAQPEWHQHWLLFIGNVGTHPQHICKRELGIAMPCSAAGRKGSPGRVGLTAHPRTAAIPGLPDTLQECWGLGSEAQRKAAASPSITSACRQGMFSSRTRLSSPGTTSSGSSSALPMASASQEVGTGLAGVSFPANLSYSFGREINFCCLKGRSQSKPCWAVKMDSFLEIPIITKSISPKTAETLWPSKGLARQHGLSSSETLQHRAGEHISLVQRSKQLSFLLVILFHGYLRAGPIICTLSLQFRNPAYRCGEAQNLSLPGLCPAAFTGELMYWWGASWTW